MPVDRDLVDAIAEAIRQALGSGGGGGGGIGGGTGGGSNKALDQLIRQFDIADRELKAYNKTLVSLTYAEKLAAAQVKAQNKVALEELLKQRKERKITEEQFAKSLRTLKRNAQDLSETLGELNDESTKELLQKIKAAEKNEDYLKKVDDLKKSIFSLSGYAKGVGVAFATLGKVGAAAGGAIKGLQGNASGMEVAGALMTAGVEAAGSAAKLTGDTMGNMGQAMAQSTNPNIKKLGLIAGVAGPLIGGLGEAASKLAKFGIEVLLKEVEKSQKAFQDATNAGAMFADGVTGLRNAAANSGLTVEQFAGVLKAHSSLIAQSGMGVADGAKQMGRIAKDLKSSGIQTQLLNLGYSFEEQAGLIAETTANMRRTSGGKSSDKDIAEQTAKYAESLRVIAAITGEDAKKKIEETRQQNQIMAFQAEMAKKSPAQRAAIDAAMSTMTEMEKKNFRERAVLGVVINKEGAVYEATLAGAREKGEAQKRLLDGNLMTAEANSKLNAEYGEQIRRSALNNDGLNKAGMIVGGLVGDVAKGSLDAVNQANIYSTDAVAAGIEAVDAQKKTVDKATTEFVAVGVAAQQLKIAIEQKLTPSLGQFAEVAHAILSSLEDQMKNVKPGVMSDMFDWLGKIAIGLASVTTALSFFGVTAGTLSTASAGIASAFVVAAGGITSAVAAVLSIPLAIASVGDMVFGKDGLSKGGGGDNFLNQGVKKLWNQDGTGLMNMKGETGGGGTALQEYAEGGIASGSPSGFLAKLHGEELVLPMEGGQLDSGSKGFAELMKMLDSSRLTSTNVSSVSNKYSSSTANIEKSMYGTTISQSAAVGSAAGISSPDFSGLLVEMSSSAKQQQDQTTSMFGTLQKFLQEATTPAPGQTGDQKRPDQALLMEVKKMTELLIEQNKLAEEAMTFRRQLVDTAESHLRTAERTLTEVS